MPPKAKRAMRHAVRHPYKLTPEQKEKAKKLRKLRDECLVPSSGDSGGCHGQMLIGPPGDGKTGIVGWVNRQPVRQPNLNNVKMLIIFVTSNPKQADAQADEVGAEFKALDKRKIQSRLFKSALRQRLSTNVVATMTPKVLRNLVDERDRHGVRKALIDALKYAELTAFHLQYDEIHKAFGGRSKMPTLMKAFSECLGAIGIHLVITGITATPLYKGEGASKAGKVRERLAQRCCMILRCPANAKDVTACDTIETCTVEIDDACHKKIVAKTGRLQAPAPKEFKTHEVAIPGPQPSKNMCALLNDCKTLLHGIALQGLDEAEGGQIRR